MKINILTKNIDLSDSLREHVNAKIITLEKVIPTDGENILAAVEVGRTTNHHKQGDIFRAEINLTFSGQQFYAFAETEDLYTSIDEVRLEIERQIVHSKNREETLFRRGARSVKKMMKGLSKRNPFTSKY